MLNLEGMSAYVARPDGPGPHPGVVVGHLIFGVDDISRLCADRLAEAGFLAIVPDLFHRTEPLAELPRDDEGRRRGLDLTRRLTRDEVVEDVRRCMAWLRGPGGAGARVGMLGVSLGGHVAFLAAARLDLAATATLFPGWLTGDFALPGAEPTVALAPGIQGRLLFLVGDRDHIVPAADVERVAAELADAGVKHEVVVYPGVGHGFFPGAEVPATDAEVPATDAEVAATDAGIPATDAETRAAGDAWRRVLELFRAELGGI